MKSKTKVVVIGGGAVGSGALLGSYTAFILYSNRHRTTTTIVDVIVVVVIAIADTFRGGAVGRRGSGISRFTIEMRGAR